MEVVIVPAAGDIGVAVADAVASLFARRPDATIGLATGSSPITVYDELVRRHQAATISFAQATAFLLDEYVGLPVGHRQSYREVIRSTFTGRVDFAPGAVHGPDGNAADLSTAGADYEKMIASAGGVDLQLLGIGADGHIGFNEPGSSLGSTTRIKSLTAVTRMANSRFFDRVEDVPHHVLTQGVGTILRAGHLILVAAGSAKADPVAAAVEGPVTSMVPASALQLHPHATVVVDESAAARLRLADYYREAFAGKPAWQGL